MSQISKVKKYCHDCKSRLTYDRFLSNVNLPNEYRVLVYWCMNCAQSSGRSKLFMVIRKKVPDAVDAIKEIIVQET